MLETLFLSAALAVGQAQPAGDDIPAPAALAQSDPVLIGDQPGATPVPPKGPEPVQVAAPLLPPSAPAAAPAAAATPPAAPPPRWLLMKELQGTWPGGALDSQRMQVTGWVQGSYTASSAGDGSNLPLGFNYRANDFLMNQAWVRVARSVVTSGTTDPTFGFQSDFIFGTDYRFTLPRGIFNSQLVDNNGLPDKYGVDPVQFYGEAYFPTIGRGLDVKVGRFYTPFGVESIEAVSTPFLSHTYTFDNAPPFTHTGVLATLTMTPVWTVQAGIVAGNDIILFNTSDSPTFVGTVQWTQPSGGRNVVKFASVVGTADFDQGGAFANFDVFDTVWTHTFNPVLSYNMESIFGFMRDIPPQTDSAGNLVPIDHANWEGVVNYLALTLSPRLVAQARFELFNDPQGVRTSAFNVTGGPATVTDAKGLYEALTFGVIFTPRINKSVIIRPEVRWDHNDESAPYEGKHNLFTAATDLILRW